MRKLPIYFLIIILLASFVFASSNWYTWGNQGFSTRQESFLVNETFFFCYWGFCWNETLESGAIGRDNVLFGSNLRAGSTDLTEYLAPITISFPPVIADFDNSGSNEIAVVSGNKLLLYSPSLDLLGSITHSDILSNPVILNYDADTGDIDVEVIVCEGSDIMIYDYNNVENSGFTLVQEWSGVCGDVAGNQFIYADSSLGRYVNFSLGQEVFSVYRPDLSPTALRPVRTDVTNGTRHTGQSSIGGAKNRCHDDFGNGFTVDDIDSDGKPEYIAITGGGPTTLSAFDIDGSFKYSRTLIGFDTGNETCNLGIAQVGGAGGFKEVLVQYYDKAGSNQSLVEVYDSSNSVIYSNPSASTNQSFFSVANVNYDSDNEFITFPNEENVFVFNQLVGSVLIGNLSNSTFSDSDRLGYISVGEYNQRYDYQEILTRKGIFEFLNVVSGTGELHQIYEFSSNFDSPDAQVFPVSLQSSTSFNKDVLVYENDLIGTYLDSVTGAVCGNDFCESGENTLNCPIDCQAGVDALASGFCAEIRINPSVNVSWQNGTRVQMQVTAQSEDNLSLVRSRAFLYWQESLQWDSGWTNHSPSGTQFNFETFANHTTPFSEIVIYCQNTVNTGDLGRQTFPYSVTLQNGISHGDGIYTFTHPSGLAPAEGEPDPSDNSVKTFIDQWDPLANQFGIGYLGVWLLLMLGVFGFTLLLAGMLKWSGQVTLMLTLVSQALMVVLGGILGMVPTGVLVTIVIIGVAIIIIFIRREMMGS